MNIQVCTSSMHVSEQKRKTNRTRSVPVRISSIYLDMHECLLASCHITALTQFKQYDICILGQSNGSPNDHHPNTIITYTNCIDGMSPSPCQTVWYIVDLEEVWVEKCECKYEKFMVNACNQLKLQFWLQSVKGSLSCKKLPHKSSNTLLQVMHW